MKKAICRIITILSATLALGGTAKGQLYVNNVNVATNANSLVFVDGDVTNDGQAFQDIIHHGLMEVKGSWYNTSNSRLVFDNTSNGIVLLNGDLQTFNGYNTRFPNLTLAGTNVKRQFATIEINHLLDLTDRELDVNGNTASVLSNIVNAVKYDGGGYVNTSVNNRGWLVRNLQKDSTYVFPLGNNTTTFRFRPLVVRAVNAGNVFGQFQHYNPAKDAYPVSSKDNSVVRVNDLWYHALITDAANGNRVNIQMPYHTAADGSYTTIAQWKRAQAQWSKLPSTAPTPNISYNTNNILLGATVGIDLNNINSIPVALATDETDLIKISSVITPNGDNHNDKWIVSGMPANAQVEVAIFNRWNNVVYRSHNYTNDWDGSGLNAGTYFYVVKLTVPGGSVKEYKGYITLMR